MMIDLPSLNLDDLDRLADWVELSTLAESTGALSQDNVARVLRASGLVGYARTEVFVDDEAFADDDLFSDDETANRLAEQIWEQFRYRVHSLSPAYPFDPRGATLMLKADTWRDVPAYSMLLVLDVGRSYKDQHIGIVPDTTTGRLFEKVVEASVRGLLRGPSSRFGWPIEPSWPTGIDDRVERLAEELELQVENLQGKTDPQDKDRGLDVVGRMAIADGSMGTVAVLVQCAAGEKWTEKKGEPSLANWRDILRWDAELVRGVAVPWRLQGRWDIRRAYRHFDALILDRPRLLAGNPDAFLDEHTKTELVSWCVPLFQAFRRID